MIIVTSLWLPTLLSAVAVFVISSLVHMVFKWHAPDYRSLANEEDVREVLRAGKISPGRYVIPYCRDMKAMSDPAMVRKYQDGPIAQILVGPSGVPQMGKYLGQWFLWTLVVAAVTAYLTVRVFGLHPGHAHGAAKLAGVITLVAYGFGTVTESIWMMRPWSSSAKHLVDATLYAVATAMIFLWLWP